MKLNVARREARPHVVSLRFTDRQLAWLNQTANQNSVRLQEVVRSLVDHHIKAEEANGAD